MKGVVAAVSSYLADNDASITESNHFNDQLTNSFSMRTAFRPDGPGFPDLDSLRQGFQLIARRFRMDWQLVDMTVKPKVVIAVSKFGHCLYDLLHRARSGSLPIDIPAVISNHDDMRSFVEWSGIPYHHLPVKGDKAAQEAAFMDVVNQAGADLVVLARYMQILSADLCGQLAGRCINIHHSFLPSFKGAKPYHQAHARGVKLIGATAHYVTTDLDEGPIIEQGIERVDHTQTPEDLVDIGRDIECAVLARAVRWHIERRILVTGQKTIVFS
ncbi:Formyltetrahydrofolate deformylase [Nitrospirillum viridazoti Y2]|nr:Formyltetrahydrofolate deformylase [Nitrospirillum amazonense Y2]